MRLFIVLFCLILSQAWATELGDSEIAKLQAQAIERDLRTNTAYAECVLHYDRHSEEDAPVISDAARMNCEHLRMTRSQHQDERNPEPFNCEADPKIEVRSGGTEQ